MAVFTKTVKYPHLFKAAFVNDELAASVPASPTAFVKTALPLSRWLSSA
jgi:hypothetical protein